MTIVCWQVYIEGDGWRYSDPRTAAFVCSSAPTRVRLDEHAVPPTLRFDHVTKWADTRNRDRRVKNAAKALQRQRERVPLFADHLAALQPTAAQRVEHFDAFLADLTVDMRRFEANLRRKARRALAELPDSARIHVLCKFERAFNRGGHFALYLIDQAKREVAT